MSCMAGTEYGVEDADGVCPECGEATVEGEAVESCCYSPEECSVCGWAPCDGSC